MRVLLSRRRASGEAGAVALVAAAVATVMVAVSAFVMDFGMSYVSKRQLQTAADSAVLDAAAVYAQLQGSCDTLVANGAAFIAASAAANEAAAANRPGMTGGLTSPTCAGGELQLTYRSSGATATVFGGALGIGDSITTSRTASAGVSVSQELATGFRPMAICSAVLPSLPAPDKTFARIENPGDGHKSPASCPDAGASGNWWTTDCPGERVGSTSMLIQQILDGCANGVKVAASGDDPEALTIALREACPSAPSDSDQCLSGDPGSLDSGSIEGSWRALIDAQEPIVLPAFCVPPQCSASTLDGSGTNSVFPVYKLVSVVVCGYHFGKNVRYEKPVGSTEPCHGNPLPPILGDNGDDNYMYVVFVTQQTSGGTGDTTCALGAGCDGGLRRVRLTG